MKQNFLINKLNDNTAEMFLYGYIGSFFEDGVSSSVFARELKRLEATYRNIDLHIHSEGGSVTDGVAVRTAIKASKANITGYIDGLAASMAFVIAMSLDKVYMNKYARCMAHEVSGGTWGNSKDVRAIADVMDTMNDDLADILANKTGDSVEACKAKYLNGTDKWMTAKQCVELGIVNGIFDGPVVEVPENVSDYKEIWNVYNGVLSNSLIKTEKTIVLI